MVPATFLITFEEDIILLFTPENSPCRREQETFRQFSRMEASSISNHNEKSSNLARAPSKPKNFWWFTVCVVYKNETNIMTPEAWRNMLKVLKFVYHNFTCPPLKKSPNKILKYYPDFCDPSKGGCTRMDNNFEKIVQFLPGGDLSNQTNIKLTYPMMDVFGTKINWAELVFAGIVDNQTGLLKEARAVLIYLEFQFEMNDTMNKIAVDCMTHLQEYFQSLNLDTDNNKDDVGGLDFYPLHENMIKDELYKTKYYTLPFLAGTVGFVTAFAVLSSMDKGNVVYGSMSALLGVWTIGLALMASFGFMFICGLYFNVMITVTPFITMCVGIDNDFLMAAAWRHTDRKAPPHIRLGAAFAEVCPSLTITSLVDIVCFAIGTMIDTPAVSKFCIFTAITLAFR